LAVSSVVVRANPTSKRLAPGSRQRRARLCSTSGASRLKHSISTSTPPSGVLRRFRSSRRISSFNTARSKVVQLVALGNPHMTLDEFEDLSRLTAGKRKHPSVAMVITAGQMVSQQATTAGSLQAVLDFGAVLLNDTCWCMLGAPVIGPSTDSIMTNSAKYAHYGPGLTGKTFHFGNMADCVEAARTGVHLSKYPTFLACPE